MGALAGFTFRMCSSALTRSSACLAATASAESALRLRTALRADSWQEGRLESMHIVHTHSFLWRIYLFILACTIVKGALELLSLCTPPQV